MYGSFFYFFFQAEDGIRDIGVTGVQTCALPISRSALPAPPPAHVPARPVLRTTDKRTPFALSPSKGRRQARSHTDGLTQRRCRSGDRKSGVEGKRVDLGGRRIIKKKKTETHRAT